MDKQNEESGCYDNKLSEVRCKKCSEKIEYENLKYCKQDDGSYLCPACLHDIDTEKLREKMGRD